MESPVPHLGVLEPGQGPDSQPSSQTTLSKGAAASFPSIAPDSSAMECIIHLVMIVNCSVMPRPENITCFVFLKSNLVLIKTPMRYLYLPTRRAKILKD